ncbi:hypothetical protein BDV97DRAFT_399509 [Delphinella strobiligena]|nr:hypothetical protein BDV97DRAFT_399509 [Delphinella strobiligena]
MAPVTRQMRLRRTAHIVDDHNKRHCLHQKFLRRGLSKDQSPENRIELTKGRVTARKISTTVTGLDFFELPAESRKMIYASACREAGPLLLDFLEPAPWMLASKQVLHESTPILLASNVFRTLICSNVDYDDMGLAVRQQPEHSATHVPRRMLEWLDGTLCANAPLIRDIGFAFADDPQGRDCFFRLSYKNDKPVLSHGHCIMCDEEGFGPHVQPYAMNHPALSPSELVKDRVLAWYCDAYHRMKRRHDEELQRWDTMLKSFNLGRTGLSLQKIEEIARTLRNHYIAPYVSQANHFDHSLYPPATNLAPVVQRSHNNSFIMASTHEIDTANASAMPPSTSLSNLPLPSELRLQIFEYALTCPVTISLSDEPSSVRGGTVGLNEHMQLLADCPPACIWTTQSIFREAMPVFFKKNVFRVTIRPLDVETTDSAEKGIRFLDIVPNSMRWLNMTGAPEGRFFREVVFELHGYTKGAAHDGADRVRAGLANFLLRYMGDGNVEVVHRDCAFCQTYAWNLPGDTLRNQLPDLSHPSLAGQDGFKRAYAETWREHSHHLRYLKRGIHALDLDPLGASLKDIDRVADVIRSSFGTPDAIVPPMIIPTFKSVAHFVSRRLDAVRIVYTSYQIQEQWETQKLSEIAARRRGRVMNFTIAAGAAAAHGYTIAADAERLAIALKFPSAGSEGAWDDPFERMQHPSIVFDDGDSMINVRAKIAEAQKAFNKLLMSVSRMQAELHEARDQLGALAN